MSRMLVSCVYGNERQLTDVVSVAQINKGASAAGQPTSAARKAAQLIFCIAGLQVSYLTWGLLQEKIMTKVECSNSTGEDHD